MPAQRMSVDKGINRAARPKDFLRAQNLLVALPLTRGSGECSAARILVLGVINYAVLTKGSGL